MIKIICFGKIKEQYLKDLISDYELRLRKYVKLEIIELKDSTIQANETKSLLNIFNKSDYNILLDINGKNFSSEELARKLDNIFIINSNITFIIGSSVGVEPIIKNMVNERISFSSNTFPHGLFRGILLEQIYRCFKIN
ncbi:MAG: 23S rRNA (pseudouridine(1915)-N(3))-methyltransferase RlmH, partial [Bacilli bacterium]